jgi:hypothetical protein
MVSCFDGLLVNCCWLAVSCCLWAVSSVGRALHSHCRGRRFDSGTVHHVIRLPVVREPNKMHIRTANIGDIPKCRFHLFVCWNCN